MAEPDPFARRLLHEAVATPSPSGHEAAVVARLAELAAGRADEVSSDLAGNLVVRHGHGPLGLTFLGHVDTVPGVVPVEERDGRLYGRGSVDAKGPLCAALAATARLSETAKEALTVRVVGAVGEEAPGSVGAHHAVATLPAPDLLVICEPSGWDAVTLGYKGHLRLRLSADRPSGHSAGPEPSAADRVIDAAWSLRRLAEDLTAGVGGRAFDAVQATVLDLRRDHDGLRERAVAVMGFRLPPTWPHERLLARIDERLADHDVEGEMIEALDAVRGPKDGPLARAFRTAIRAHGGRPRTVVKTGTSDWNVVAPSWTAPTLAYGPGDAQLDHTPNEHLDLTSFDVSVEVLTSVLERLSAG